MNGVTALLLWTFSALLIAIGFLQLMFERDAGVLAGASSLATGAALSAVAASSRKKTKNG